MPRIVTLAGSPGLNSSSTLLLSAAEELLRNAGFSIQRFSIHDFCAEDLIRARTDHSAGQALQAAIADAQGLVIASPVYQGSFTAGLKAILDQIPHRGLRGKTVLSISTSGSAAYRQSLEFALLPVLKTLEAEHILPGLNIAEQELVAQKADPETPLVQEIRERLQESLDTFLVHPQPAQAAA